MLVCNRLAGCVTASCVMFATYNTAQAQLGQGFISDVHVECEVIDPEVDETVDVMVWQRINQQVLNFAYAQKVNPTSGNLTGTAGQIAINVSAYQYAQAGPKFSNGHDGSNHELYVVYSKRPPGVDTNRSMAFLKYDGEADGCDIDSMDDCFPLDGENGDDHPETRAIVYSTEEEELNTEPARAVYRYRIPDEDVNALCWVDLNEWLDDTGPEACFHEPTVEWGRIKEINGDQWIVTTFESGAFDLMQVALVNIDDPEEVEIITGKTNSGAANDPQPNWEKFNPITWYDPATSSYMLVVRQYNSNQERSDIAIWRRQTNGTWTHYLTLSAENIGEDMDAEPPLTYCLSPEPFVWNNRSYIALSTADDITVTGSTDGNIWIVRVPTPSESLDFSRQVNTRSTGIRRRVEAETYVLTNVQGIPTTPVIYYSLWENPLDAANCDHSGDTTALELQTLRRASTGL